MSHFDDLAAEAGASTDAVFADAFAFTPMAPAAERAAGELPDASRTATQLCAVFFDAETKPVEPNSWDTREYRRPGIEAGAPRLEISLSELRRLYFQLGVAFAVQPGDLFNRLKDNSAWRAHAVFATVSGTLRVKLNKAD